jgi:uncharacterized protein (TIGR03118 family)
MKKSKPLHPTLSADAAAPRKRGLTQLQEISYENVPALGLSRIDCLIRWAFASAQHYTQINLVANTSGVAPVTEPHLVNPWGLSRTSGSPWWISDNGTGLSTLYNGAGAIIPLVVTIPRADPNSKTFPTGTPTGTIANSSPTDFVLAPGAPAAFLFSTLDGTISGWNPNVGIAAGGAPGSSTHAVIVVKTTDGSSYTGLTSAIIKGNRFLYAANFNKGTVDVYNIACLETSCPSTCRPSVTTSSSLSFFTRKASN